MKRLAHPRTAGAVLTLVVALSLLLTTISSAASLSIFAQMGGVFAQNAERCTNATLAVTPSGTPNGSGQYNRVTVSGDFGSCSSGNISLYLASSPHTVLFSAPITVSGGSVEVTTPYFTAPATADGAIVLGLDGWLVPASWDYTAPVPQGPVTPGTNIEIVGGTPQWSIQGQGAQFCFTATVRGTSAVAQSWRLDLHVNQRPFNGRTSASGLQLDTWNGYGWVSNSAVNGVLQVRGTGAKQTITSSQQYTVTVCDYGAPVPVYDESLTYTTTVGSITGDSNNACIPVTVTVSGTPQFYAGWRTDLDLSSLFAFVTNQNPKVRASNGRTVDHMGGNVYRISGTTWNHGGIRDDDPQVFEVCLS